MTMRLDIVTNDAGELVRREHARELGAGVVVAIYRLAKLAQMHDLSNQAFTRQLEQTHQIIGDYCLRAGTNVNVLFAHKAVFVAGQLLKGSRGTYEAASELGEIFERLGGSELFVQRDVTREELHAFAEQISIGYRSARGSFRSPTPKIRLRPVADAARLRGLELENLSPEARIVRTYASAVVIMRRFFEDLSASKYILPRRIKRIAQSLVDLSEGSTPAFLGVTEVRNANFDEAGRAANTAILAVSMAREITTDRVVLSQIAMAAMMHDVARPRALALAAPTEPAMAGMAGPSALSEDQEDHLAAGAAAVLTALGRVNEPSITRTVLAFEALWLRRQTWLGPVYWGTRPATLHAKIIAIARRYNDLLTPDPGLLPPTPDFAVAELAEELKEPIDRLVLRLLLSALGLLPIGTVVQLATGEIAEVVRGPRAIGEKVRVRIVSDATGTAPGIEVELSEDPRRSVVRVVSVERWRKDRDSDANVRDSRPETIVEPIGRVLTESALPSIEMFTSNAAEGSAEAKFRPDREPTARGNLSTTPLPHVLIYMLDHALTGTVIFNSGPGRDTVFFSSGVPKKVRLREPVAPIGQVLMHAGTIDGPTLERAIVEARRTGSLLGEYLIERDLVTREAVDWALSKQLLDKIAHLANLPPTIDYAYYRDVDLLEDWGGSGIVTRGALSPILASIRSWMNPTHISETLRRLGTRPLVLHPEAKLDDLAMLPEEAAIIDALRAGSTSFDQLMAMNLAPHQTVSAIVYMLVVTRQFLFNGQKKGPVPRKSVSGRVLATASLVEPVALPAEADQPRASSPSITSHADQSRTSSPSISLHTAAPYVRAARPPTLAGQGATGAPRVRPIVVKKTPAGRPEGPAKGPPAPSLAEGPPTERLPARRIPRPRSNTASPSTDARVSPAASPPPMKPRPAVPVPSALKTPAAAPSEVRVEPPVDAAGALEAMTHFRLAQAALMRGETETALTLAQEAVDGDPQADYRALLAWVRSLGGNPSVLHEAITTMSGILSEDPSNEHALLYRGKLFVRTAQPKLALADFNELLSINPDHREAAMEVRLLKSRK
ncbi:MAG: hypothetical protein FWD69_03980 [Polyangiaceae bacterium]|nr:hypothetical protein [Polyangiaceae bacterium]